MESEAVVAGEPVKGGDESEDGVCLRKDRVVEGGKRERNAVEPHTLAAALVLVAAVACEASTARDLNPGEADCPSSMRISSLVCALALASPAIKGVNRVDQRSLLAAALAALAFSGLHRGSEGERGGDAYYTVVVLWLSTQIVASGGIETDETRPDAAHNKSGPHRKQTVSAWCGALFLYVGLRGLRAAFSCASEARGFSLVVSVNGAEAATRGYAGANAVVAGALGFGHGVACAVGLLVLMHGGVGARGSYAVAFEAGMSGLAMAVAAGVAFLATSHGIEALPLLYDSATCSAGQACAEASRARRFALANQSSASLWVCALAALVYSFAVERRLYEVRAEAGRPAAGARAWRRSGFGASLCLAAAAALGVWQFCTFSGAQAHTDYIAIAAVVALFIEAWMDLLSGMLVYAVAFSVEQALLVQNYGVEHVFNHLTHVSLFVHLGLLWLFVALVAFKQVLAACFSVSEKSPFSALIGLVATAGASLALALYLASTVLLACSTGDLPSEAERFRDNSAKRFSVAFLLDHWLPLFVWLPALAGRREANLLSERVRAWAWLAVVPVVGLLYMISLDALAQSAPTAEMLGATTVVPTALASVVAWSACGFV